MIRPASIEGRVWWWGCSIAVWYLAIVSWYPVHRWTLWEWAVVNGTAYVAFYRFGY